MPPSITIRRTQQLSADTRVAIVELCTEAHQKDFSRLFFRIPTSGLHFLAYRGDQIVSHAVVITRWLQPADQPMLRTAYVEAIATLPLYQRLGYGTALMREVAANISDYDIACLESDQPAFFERLGWERWRGPHASRSGGELIPALGTPEILILRLPQTPPLDLDRLLTLES